MSTSDSIFNGQDERRAPVYVPVLKGRRGEFSALEMMNPLTRSTTYPLIEVVPDVEIAPLRPGALMATFAHLALRWMGPIMLDGFHLSPQLGVGATAVRAVTDAARGLLQAVPVVRLTDGEDALRDAGAVAFEDGNGIAVRLTPDDLSADPRQVNRDVQELVEAVRIPLSFVDVLVDLGLVDTGAAVDWRTMRADNLLAHLTRVTEFRTVIVASGAFPVDLRDVMPWSVTEKARLDAAAWEHLVARNPLRVPVFGDYAIAHPRMLPPSSGFPSPQLRYTVADRWLVLRGTRSDRRSNKQFYGICEEICRHPEFSGSELGKADQWIANATARGPGNASTWRSIGTAHHADFVVARLLNREKP